MDFSFKDEYFLSALKNINRKIRSSDRIFSGKIGYSPKIYSIKHYAFLKEINFDNNDYLLENMDTFSPDSDEYKKADELYNSIKLDKDLKSINIEVFRYKQHIDWTKAFEITRSLRRGGKYYEIL